MHKPSSLAALLSLSALSVLAGNSDKPNIVVIMADDMGYSCYSHTGYERIQTPNVDKLINEGIFCTDAYATHMVCAPSRASFITGRYQSRFDYESTTGHSDYMVDAREIFLPEMLKKIGYTTGMVGKWHLGNLEPGQPHNRGFDYAFNFRDGCNYFKWHQLRENGKKVLEEGKSKHGPYNVDIQTDKAVKFIEDNKERPFFLYYATPLIHGGFDVDVSYLQPGEKERFLKPGESFVSAPRSDTTEEGIAATEAVHAAMMNAYDTQIGRLMNALKKNGLEENTIVFLTNDNGGLTYEPAEISNAPFSDGKGSFFEGGIRVPFAVKWPGHIPAGAVYDKTPVSNIDLVPTIMAVAGGTLPTDRSYDGVNILPYLKNEAQGDPQRALFFRSSGGGFIRKGKYKMHWRVPDKVRKAVTKEAGRKVYDVNLCEEVTLYDLSVDITESNDISATNPEVVEQLKKELRGYYAASENDPIYKRK